MHRSHINCHECENKNCLVKTCSSDWISRLSSSKYQMVYRPGQNIFVEGEPVNGIYFIQEGTVKVISTNASGYEHIVRLAGDGHILGHRGYGHEKYPIGAVALTHARICFIENDLLYEAFMDNPEFTYALMMFYSRELRISEQQKKFLAQMTVKEKVVFALLYIVNTFGLSNHNHAIPDRFSRQEIANIAGTNADQVSRSITELKQNAFIDTDKRRIIIKDEAGLKNLIKRYLSEIF